MTKKSSLTLILGALMAIILSGCSNDPLKINKCYYPDDPTTKAPLWVCGAKVDGLAVSAVGSYRKSAAGYNAMKKLAIKNARVALAETIQADISSTVETALNIENNSNVEEVKEVSNLFSSQATNVSLQGTEVFTETLSPNGHLYVLIGFNEELYKSYVKKVINETYKNSKSDLDNLLTPEQQGKLSNNL